MNRHFIYYMWTSIPRKYVKDLVSRVIQGLVLMVAAYTAIKYFPLVFVSLVTNLAPLLTAVLSYFIFRVSLSKLDTIVLLISFIGVTVLITGGNSPQEQSSEDGETDVET